jgi:hypothetical protein
MKAPTTGFTSDDIGTGFDGSAKYVNHKYFVFQAGVGRLFPVQIMTHIVPERRRRFPGWSSPIDPR